MRIISKERDYYDTVMAFGQDLSVTYVRDRHEVPIHKTIAAGIGPLLASRHVIVGDTDYGFYGFTVIICGKIYRGVQIVEAKSNDLRAFKLGDKYAPPISVFYEYDKLATYMQNKNIVLKDDYHWDYYRDSRRLDEKKLKSLFKNQGDASLSKFLIEQKIVTMTLSMRDYEPFKSQFIRPEWVCFNNNLLGPFEFGKLFDGFSAYQEIDMYVSGTLANNLSVPIALTEKDRVAQHGFDQWSFRKMPSKK